MPLVCIQRDPPPQSHVAFLRKNRGISRASNRCWGLPESGAQLLREALRSSTTLALATRFHTGCPNATPNASAEEVREQPQQQEEHRQRRDHSERERLPRLKYQPVRNWGRTSGGVSGTAQSDSELSKASPLSARRLAQRPGNPRDAMPRHVGYTAA